MKHLVLLVIFMGMLTAHGYSQQLTTVSSNTLAPDLVAHTLKFSESSSTNSSGLHDDVNPGSMVPTELNPVLFLIRQKADVTRATFDQATQTITILSNPNLVITDLVAESNELLNAAGHE